MRKRKNVFLYLLEHIHTHTHTHIYIHTPNNHLSKKTLWSEWKMCPFMQYLSRSRGEIPFSFNLYSITHPHLRWMRSLTVKTPSHGKNVVVVVFLFVLIIDEGKLSEGDFLLIRTFSIILLFSIRSRRTNRKSKKNNEYFFSSSSSFVQIYYLRC